MGADAEDLALTIHPHPTLSETVGFAAEVGLGTITDLPPKRALSAARPAGERSASAEPRRSDGQARRRQRQRHAASSSAADEPRRPAGPSLRGAGPARPGDRAAGRRHGELLGGQDVVRLGIAGRVLGQHDRAVMELGVGRRHLERLGGEHVVGGVVGLGRVGLGHRAHVLRMSAVGAAQGRHARARLPQPACDNLSRQDLDIR